MAPNTLTVADLSRTLGETVPEVYLLVAKHEAFQLDATQIADTIGVKSEEIQELQQEGLYQKVLLLVKSASAQRQVETQDLWDQIEHTGLKRLADRVAHETDSDFLLKVAAVANKAQRRSSNSNVLTPGGHGIRVPLTLSSRITRKLNGDGSMEETREHVSVLDGTHGRASFDEVDGLLQVSNKPFMDRRMSLETQTAPDPSVTDMLESVFKDEERKRA